MATMQAPTKLMGARVKRREDPRLITGRSTYLDDLQLPGMVYMSILRSPYAHARIRRIDVSRALQMPGVVAAFTGAEVRELTKPLPVAITLPNMKKPDHWALAMDKVRYVGDGVAAVIARGRYQARDALDLIEVEYEELPAVVDLEKAMEPGSVKVHDELENNIAYHWELGGGDVERAFQEAEVVIKQRMVNQRLIPNPMETRGVLAQYQGGQLTVWSSTQVPHALRTQLALGLGLSENNVRVITPEVGGGFGSKLNIYAEEFLAAAAAIKLNRPVKWVEERRENFLATTHGRDHVADIELAAKRDGRITGLRIHIRANLGAYHQIAAPLIPTLTALMQTGVYDIQNARTVIDGIFTNTTPVDAYRGAGRPEAAYYIERMVDILAAELGMDPTEVRRKNFIPKDAFPYKTVTGLEYDSGNYEAALDRALAMVDYQGFRREQEQARQQGRLLGIGFASWVEICGFGPSRAGPGMWESGKVRVDPTGKITVMTGTAPHGQGEETSFAQIVADQFGVPIEDVTVLHGDTAVIQGGGLGTQGSRALAVGGPAIYLAGEKVRAKIKRIAGHLMDASPEDLEFENGRIYVRGSPDRGMSFTEVVTAAYRGDKLPPGEEPGLEAEASFDPSNYTFPFGTCAAIVEVDPETGKVTLRRYISVDDCGKAINPLLVDGQLHGGITQGVAQALFEEAVYDENGQLLTGSLMDYAIPKAADLPRFEMDRTETPTPANPLGAKGIGEAGTIAATPAVVNAVVDALKHLGIRHIDMPLKAERVWRAMQAAQGR